MTTVPRLVLASSSPARLKLLRQIGIEPDVVVSGVDESTVTGPPADVALTLAVRKATAVARGLSDAVVLGCDSVLDLDGEALGKPATPRTRSRGGGGWGPQWSPRDGSLLDRHEDRTERRGDGVDDGALRRHRLTRRSSRTWFRRAVAGGGCLHDRRVGGP